MLASDAGLPEANSAVPLDSDIEDDGGSSGGEEEAPARRRGRGRAAAPAFALPEELEEPSGKFKQSGFYIPHARWARCSSAGVRWLALHVKSATFCRVLTRRKMQGGACLCASLRSPRGVPNEQQRQRSPGGPLPLPLPSAIAHQQPRALLSASRTGQQDEAGYSVHGPAAGGGGCSGLEAAVMDMVGEDAGTIAASKGTYHWDKRHKKYVQLQPGEEVRAGKRMRAESGAAVSFLAVFTFPLVQFVFLLEWNLAASACPWGEVRPAVSFNALSEHLSVG